MIYLIPVRVRVGYVLRAHVRGHVNETCESRRTLVVANLEIPPG